MRPRTVDGVVVELTQAWERNDLELAKLLESELNHLDHPPHPVPVLGAALWYAQHGLPVFPLQPATKVPYPHTRGCKDATTDPDQVRAMFTTRPGANLGLATGHRVDVLDFDGAPGHLAWSQAVGPTWADAELEVLATVSTPRPGGLHVYLATTGDPNRAGLVPGVDYRGRGGYVLAPPSVLDDRPGQHPGPYRFLQRLDPELIP